MPFQNNSLAGSLAKQAATPATGFALINGTPTIISYTTPNDGNIHTAIVSIAKIVTSTETGGQINITYTIGGQAQNLVLLGGANAPGVFFTANAIRYVMMVDPNTTVSIVQAVALTAGASVVYVELFGA
jgi:hypothetical protein